MMGMKNKMVLAVVVTLLLIIGACSNKDITKNDSQLREQSLSNLTDTEMPIVKEKISLDIFTGKSLQNVRSDWNDILIWNTYEEMTNIEVNWEQVDGDSLVEKRNLTLVGDSDEIPDVFYASRMPVLDLLKYGEQGVFIPLNDLIEKHAPHFSKMLEQYPEIEKAITFPDGNIYSLPIIYEPEFSSLLMGASPWFNKEWLSDLDMDIPETTDEFYEYLLAVKEKNLSEDKDAIPFGTLRMDFLMDWLKGSFGVANRGVDYIDMDLEKDEMRFYPTTDEYKALLEYIHKLYAEELIEQSIYTHEHADYLSKLEGGTYASSFYYSPSGEADIYAPGNVLEGPYGDKEFTSLSHPVGANGQFVITKANEHPEATIRWVDYFYGDEGSKLFYMGIEGETFEKMDDGTYEYVERITKSPDGLSLNEEIVKELAWVGASAPSVIKQEYFSGTESSPRALAAAEILEPYFITERWPAFLYTAEESKELTSLSADIEKYVDEMRDKFITGNTSFDEWDNYIERLNSMGLIDYMKIQEQAYERYTAN